MPNSHLARRHSIVTVLNRSSKVCSGISSWGSATRSSENNGKACTSRLAGDARSCDRTLRSEPHQQLARHGISAAELPGSVGAHVPAANRRGEAQQLVEVLAKRDVATDVDERVWGDFLVDDHRRARISAEVSALD